MPFPTHSSSYMHTQILPIAQHWQEIPLDSLMISFTSETRDMVTIILSYFIPNTIGHRTTHPLISLQLSFQWL